MPQLTNIHNAKKVVLEQRRKGHLCKPNKVVRLKSIKACISLNTALRSFWRRCMFTSKYQLLLIHKAFWRLIYLGITHSFLLDPIKSCMKRLSTVINHPIYILRWITGLCLERPVDAFRMKEDLFQKESKYYHLEKIYGRVFFENLKCTQEAEIIGI